jgi:TolB-like protein
VKGNIAMFRTGILILLGAVLSGCMAVEQAMLEQSAPTTPIAQMAKPYDPSSEEGRFHRHVELLARQLFDTAGTIDVNRPLIVGTFVPANDLKIEPNPQLQFYATQLQESMITFATQAGLNVIEFKTRASVELTDNADLMLSRDLTKLGERVKAEYLLTGTYTQQQNSLMVNARLINYADKSVLAAATGYIPLNSMWSHDKVKIKNQRLYRGEY